MTAPAFVTAQMVRDYLNLEASGSSRYSDSTLGSNIRAAANFLERRTNRYLFDRTTSVTITTNGKAYIQIPGLRAASSVELAGGALTADTSYWLVPDEMDTGLYTGVQLRGFNTTRGGPWYLGVPDWFERNLDHPYWNTGPGAGNYSLPNDLVITGTWGFVAGTEPEEVLHVNKVLAAYFTKRPDAVLSGGVVTEEGGIFDLSQLPIEVAAFISDWRLGAAAVSV